VALTAALHDENAETAVEQRECKSDSGRACSDNADVGLERLVVAQAIEIADHGPYRYAIDRVALAHDYLTQRGGAERVVLALVRAFPQAPLYTSLYDPAGTFPAFGDAAVRTSGLNLVAPLRQRHRLALPLLAPVFSRLRIEAEVAVCSSSGWAHGAKVDGRKVVYCHAPARWLYQRERYLGDAGPAARIGLAALRRPLERWDRKAAASAHRYLANSTWIARELTRIYGIEAEVVHPPVTIDAESSRRAPAGVEPGYALCVSRLLPYKNVDAVVTAFEYLRDERLVVVGEGPDEQRVRALAGPNVRFVGRVDDDELRWLYGHARCLVASSYEDFGLTPIEAAAFGKPTAALHFGGYLDTVRGGETGIFFMRPEPTAVADAVRAVLAGRWDEEAIRLHAGAFSEERFARRLREVVAEELAAGQ
jgi:glycosyltransferase involved in cell wall biosynthesis